MYDKTQLMRGSLEGCILKIIEQHMTYGYEILMNMKEAGWIDVTEGTLYPILLRLEKSGSIAAELKPSPAGPKRKYYHLTAAGTMSLIEFQKNWRSISEAVDSVLEGGKRNG